MKLFRPLRKMITDNRRVGIFVKKVKINWLLKKGIPKDFKNALMYLVNERLKKDESEVVLNVEKIRYDIASQKDKKIEIWYSPKPGSSGQILTPNMRPEHGEILQFSMEQIANTGKNKKWGLFLYILSKDFRINSVLELGSCAGIASCYLSSAPDVNSLITIEGSETLAKIAAESLKKLKTKNKTLKVINKTFDDAIDLDLNNFKPFDLVFIDGHHEKVATIHYFERIYPFLKNDALVVFDDISWSQDMRSCWTENLSKRSEFSHVIDLGVIGICVLDKKQALKKEPALFWDLRFVTGKYSIGKPHGWKS